MMLVKTAGLYVVPKSPVGVHFHHLYIYFYLGSSFRQKIERQKGICKKRESKAGWRGGRDANKEI